MTAVGNANSLIERLKSTGRVQQSAYVELLDLYQERVYWHVRRMVYYHEDADDVVQNTFVKVWKGLAGFEENASLYTWVYRIATNEAITHLRKRKRKIDMEVSDELLHEHIAADTFFDGDKVQVLLKAAIARLPERQRAVFVMRYYEEMPYRDIADVAGVSEGSLKASYHHATKKIKDYIERHATT